jgi:type IV pilus assembly protein PilF
MYCIMPMLGLMLSLMLGGCVTETTGGFNAKKSDADALKNYIQLATGYLEQNNLPIAKRHLANAVKIDANNSEIFAIWALVYAREGEAALAKENFARSLRIDAKNSKARNNFAAFLFAQEEFEAAYEQLQIVVDDTEYEARAQSFENLALVALRLNRLPEADAAFARALQLNPNQLRSTLELASLMIAKPDVARASAYYRNYVTLTQLYNVAQNPRSLWIGIQIEAAQGNKAAVEKYGQELENNFVSAPEIQRYRDLVDTLK